MRILLWTFGGESLQHEVAESLRAGIARLSPSVEIESLDVHTLMKPLARSVIKGGVRVLLDWIPSLWELLYESEGVTGHPGAVDSFRRVFDFSRLEALLSSRQPDLLVGFHPLALLPAVWLKREGQLRVPVVAIHPGFHVHRSWAQPGISRYVVSHPLLEDQLTQAGVPAEKLRSPGILLPLSYEGQPSRRELQVQYGVGLPEGAWEPIVLLLADDFEEWECEEIFERLSGVGRPCRWIFYAGDEEDRRRCLREGARRWGLKAKMFGGQRELREYYRLADVVVGRTDLLGLIGCLGCETPVLLWDSGEAGRRKERAFLVERGVVEVFAEVDELGVQLEVLLEEEVLVGWQSRCVNFLASDATRQITAMCFDLLHRKEEVLRRDEELLSLELSGLRGAEGEEEGRARIWDPARLLGGVLEAEGSASVFEDIGPSGPTPLRGVVFPVRGVGVQEEFALCRGEEDRLRRALEDAQREVVRWRQRLALALDAKEERLALEAGARVEELEGKSERLHEEWEACQERLGRLEAEAFQKSGSAVETREDVRNFEEEDVESGFRALELENELERLKKRLRLQSGDLSKLKDEDL